MTCRECGRQLSGPDQRKFCSRACANRHHSGPLNGRFNGGLSACEGRTIIVHREGKHWTFYYRALMEAQLGRPLGEAEIVHHINGDQSDDRLENLTLVTRAEHVELHRDELTAAKRAALGRAA